MNFSLRSLSHWLSSFLYWCGFRSLSFFGLRCLFLNRFRLRFFNLFYFLFHLHIFILLILFIIFNNMDFVNNLNIIFFFHLFIIFFNIRQLLFLYFLSWDRSLTSWGLFLRSGLNSSRCLFRCSFGGCFFGRLFLWRWRSWSYLIFILLWLHK